MNATSHRLVVLLLVALCLAAGCTREPTSVELTEVPAPNGGTPLTVVSNQTGVVAAPTGNGLYVHGPAESDTDPRWSRIRIPWPDDIQNPGQSPTESLESSVEGLGFSGNQRFTSFQDQFWLIARPGPDRPPRLLVSDSAATNWRAYPLPPMYRRGERLETPADSTPALRLRLLNYGDDGLYLVDQQRVWSWEPPTHHSGSTASRADAGTTTSSDTATAAQHVPAAGGWNRLDILDLRRSGAGHELPPAIRHYVPQSERRPFELLTVFSDELYIYRRWQNADRWLLVSTLPTADRRVQPLPDGSIVMLAGDRLHRSMQEAEQWERLDVRRPAEQSPQDQPPNYLDITSFSVSDSGDNAPGTNTFFAGTRSGAIYRTNRRGYSWRSVRTPDQDRRRVTSLTHAHGSIWAGLAGPGLIRSTDRGSSWNKADRGFRASEPLDVAIGANGELLVATRAGLFRLTGRPKQGIYQAIQTRATSSVSVSDNGNWIVSGTTTGDVVIQTPEGRLRTVDTRGAPRQGVRVRPPRTVGQQLPDSAIVKFAGRPGSSNLFAVPAHGPLWRTSGEPLDWQSTPIPEAFRSTLRHTVVTDVLAETPPDEPIGHLFFVTRRLDHSAGTRLWSSLGGDRWRSVTSYPAEPPPGRRLFDMSADNLLFVASNNQIRAASFRDGYRSVLVERWAATDPLMAYDLRERRHVLIHRAPHATLLRLMTTPDADGDLRQLRQARIDRKLELSWRHSDQLPVSPIADVAAFDSSLYLTTGRAVFFGTIPPERVQIPHGPTIAITLLILLVLASLSFLFLHQQLQ